MNRHAQEADMKQNRTLRRTRTAAAAALAASALTGAWAAPAGTGESTTALKKLSLEELMGIEVATVTTASKKAEKATDAPATVLVITASDIRLRGYANLKDVLRDLPGMETIGMFFSEFGTQVPVRGIAGNNKIIVLVNGMRVNPPGGENFPFRSDFSVRNAERIEVIYGPGSTLYGQDAISAVINVITKQPGGTWGGEAGAAAGLHDARDAWGTFGGPVDREGRIRLSGFAQYHDSDLAPLDEEYPGWWAPYRALAEPRGSGQPPHRRDYGLNLFGRLDLYEDTSLQVWHRDSLRSSSESGYPPAYIRKARWEDASTVVEGRNTWRTSEAVTLDSALTYNRYEIDPDTRYVFDVPGLPDAWFLNDFKYGVGEGWTIEETVRAKIDERLELVGGLMAATYNVIPKSTVPGGADPDGDVVDQGGSFFYSHPEDPGTLHEIPRVTRSRYETYAAYVEAGWQMAEDLKLIAGTRVTKDTRFDDLPLTPRLALLYDLSEQLKAKYIYTRAYVAPAPYFADAVYDDGSDLATSNSDLDPETAETHEVNLAYSRKNLSLGLTGYYGTQRDIITLSDQNLPQNILAQVVYLDGDPAQPRQLVRTANAGESSRYGGELYGHATFGPLSPWFSYSYVDYEEENDRETRGLLGISAHNGRLGLTWAVTRKLFVTPSLVIRSTPEGLRAGALEDELETPWQADLYVLYSLHPSVDLFADVRNVTDHHYALGGITGSAVPQETLGGTMGVRASF